ncbi:hypothetical protein VB780_13910 [Leptolyngbya sp. CCNP1308]|uniref:hypothetical protein n=1 Tax=Leptolyngbya sp. CCNP1308 TaxID=3110255 RepID=UPI002B22157D|nr:hypothetical protein [Leptolyngbya sp. CCNP1308]MEA5449676.1 hypothetical protein [Leptolyngbya sp. CCNP1308]
MGLFGRRKRDDDDDRSLIEISNDSGDHLVVDIPTSGVKETEKALRDAGVERDDDERLVNTYQPRRIVDSRDSKQHRYRSERVVDEAEDLEDSYDREDVSDMEDDPSEREDDTSDFEESEQPATWRSWW